MNKIYSDPIEKAKMLIACVEKQKNILQGKGVSIDVDALSKACELLEEAGEKQAAVESELKVLREDAHRKLDVLKALYTEFKTPIKQNFSPEVWSVFGLPDKK
ncbi:MAG: hypothetical protein E7089_05030 [Bacteroidales bacterium]|nr:hypothetical protein [Bacteroidales bacterium]MBR2606782.1 hypothetical protein [Bacteroidaceae bacterium]